MADRLAVHLPPLAGRQGESWAALLELSTTSGEHWLLVGGQMVFVHDVHRNARDIRPTDDIDVVVDLRVQPTGLAAMHRSLRDAGFTQDQPSTDGIVTGTDAMAPSLTSSRRTTSAPAPVYDDAPQTSPATSSASSLSSPKTPRLTALAKASLNRLLAPSI